MRFAPIPEALLTAFAGLFLVLSMTAVTVRSVPSKGIPVIITSVALDELSFWGDDRLVVIQMLSGGQAKINETSFSIAEIPAQMKLIMESRQVRRVFILPSDGTTFQEVCEMDEKLHASVENLQVYVQRKESFDLVAPVIEKERQAVNLHEWLPAAAKH